jgi:hypothetical protein
MTRETQLQGDVEDHWLLSSGVSNHTKFCNVKKMVDRKWLRGGPPEEASGTYTQQDKGHKDMSVSSPALLPLLSTGEGDN